MVAMLPDEILLGLTEEISCRDFQIHTLSSVYGNEYASPRALVVYGLEATGKSLVTREVFKALKIPHAIVDSRECITGRQLLEHIVSAALDAVQEFYDSAIADPGRCENLTTLQNHLSRLLGDEKRLVLVYDGIDRQREAPHTLVPALARLGEMIPGLSIVFILSVPSPRYYHTTGIPHLHFPPYTREESIKILGLKPTKIFYAGLDPKVDYTEEEAAEDDAYVWGRFCGVVWDTLAKGAARDLISFRDTCMRLWTPFTAPIVDGTFGTRDFARLMVHRRTIFQDESALSQSLIRPTPAEETRKTKPIKHKLPYYAKYILCATYLASFNPAKQDPIFFMKSHDRKRKKKSSGLAPLKDRKNRRMPRSMLAPSPFTLDRMLAILHSILPHKLPQSADIMAQIATLASLKLVVRAGVQGVDSLDSGSRWKVNCSWEYVVDLARSLDFEIRDYLAGSAD